MNKFSQKNKQQISPKKQQKYYIGSFFSFMHVKQKYNDRLKPNENARIRQNSIGEGMQIRKLRDNCLMLFVVGKKPSDETKKNQLCESFKGDEKIYDYKVCFGCLVHCYDEIWWFLLRADYVKLTVTMMDYNPTDEYPIVLVKVFLKEKAIKDSYELKILRYPINNQKKKSNQQQTHQQQVEKRNETFLENIKSEYQRFAKLSLLLMLDLMNVKRVQPALIKSDKQFKIFFNQLQYFHRLQYGTPRQFEMTFKEVPRYVIENQKYFDSYIENTNFQNKLFTKQEIKNFVIYHKNNQYYLQDNKIFKPQIEKINVNFNVYFKQFSLSVYQEIIKFAKRSMSTVVKNKQSEWLEHVIQTVISNTHNNNRFSEGYHNNQLYIDKHKELKFKVSGLTQISGQRFNSFNNSNYPLYKYVSHPFTDFLYEPQLSQLFSEEQDISHEKYVKQICDFANGKIILSDQKDDQEQDINQFLNTYQQHKEHPTPKKMKTELKPHQKEALTFMLNREGQQTQVDEVKNKKKQKQEKLSPLWEQIEFLEGFQCYVNTFTGKISQEFQSFKETKGGILADEMGLGKTLMALALILETYKSGQQNLIVVPKSVISQWEQEIKTHSATNSLKVLSYYSQSNRKKHVNFEEYDVILTTYNILGQDYSTWMIMNGKQDELDSEIIKSGKKRCSQQMKQKQQKDQNITAIIIDNETLSEIDDINSDSESGEISYDSDNNEDDEFDENSSDSAYSPIVTNKRKQQKKPQKIKSKQIVKKQYSYEKKKKESQDLYQEIFGDKQPQQVQRRKEKFKQRIKQANNYHNLFNFSFYRVILDEAHNIKTRGTLQNRGAMELKSEYRWCLTGTPMQNKHDDLYSLVQFLQVETFSEYFWWNTYVNKEENEDDQQKILNQILQPIILRRTKNSRNFAGLTKVDEDIIWIDLNEKERLLYNRLFQGTQNLFKTFLKNGSEQKFVHVFQIINKLRMSCDHPQMALKNVNFESTSIEAVLEKVDQFFENKEVVEKGAMTDAYRKELIEKIQKGELQECKICTQDAISIFDVSICGHIYCHNCFQETVQKLGTCPTCRKRLTLKDLISVATENEESVQFIEEMKICGSSKVSAIIQETIKIKQNRQKVLIFSQWIEMIRILESQLSENDIYFQVITGSMTVEKRNKIIQKFKEQQHQTALILSLRATSTGLNLTMANHVFLVDPWWNPAIEDQAIGRADRIGQQNQVFVKRFLCKSTIESQINLLHQKKKNLIKRALTNEQKKQQDIEDYKFLLLPL